MDTDRRRKALAKILIVELEEDPGVIATPIEEFNTNLYKESDNWRSGLERVLLEKIIEEDKRDLQERVLEKEVLRAISSLTGNGRSDLQSRYGEGL